MTKSLTDDPDVLYSDEELAAMEAEAAEPEEAVEAPQEASEPEEAPEVTPAVETPPAAPETPEEAPEAEPTVLEQFEALSAPEPAPQVDEAALWREKYLAEQANKQAAIEAKIVELDKRLTSEPKPAPEDPGKIQLTEDLVRVWQEKLGPEATREQAEAAAELAVVTANYAVEQAMKPLQAKEEEKAQQDQVTQMAARQSRAVVDGLKMLSSMEGTTEQDLVREFVAINPQTGQRVVNRNSYLWRSLADDEGNLPSSITARDVERAGSALARRMELALQAGSGNGKPLPGGTTTGLSPRGAKRPATRNDKGPTADEQAAAELSEVYAQTGQRVSTFMDPSWDGWG